jgi:hypothetical protein
MTAWSGLLNVIGHGANMDTLTPKSPDIEKELVIKSCKTCYFPGKSSVGCPAQECHDCCSLSNWQEKDPLPRMGSGYSNQGGATEENDILGGLLKDGGDKPMSPSKQLLEYARELKNEAKLHNIKIEQMIKKLNKFMEENK